MWSKYGWFVVVACAIATVGGFLFGYDIGIMGGITVRSDFRITMGLPEKSHSQDDPHTAFSVGIMISCYGLGCLSTALFAGSLADLIGRKRTIILGGFVTVIGGLIQALSFNSWMIDLGRFVSGMGVGLLSTVVPCYNSEISPRSIRGSLVSLQQFSITLGILFAFIMNVVLESWDNYGWRLGLAMQSVIGAILFFGMMFLPETPRWVLSQGNSEKAFDILRKLRNTDTNPELVQEEFDQIQSTIEEEMQNAPAQESRSKLANYISEWRYLIIESDSSLIFRVIFGICLQLLQQFIGMNAIMYYAPTIFSQIGVSEQLGTLLPGIVNCIATGISLWTIEKMGRRISLLFGSIVMTSSYYLLVLIFFLYGTSELPTIVALEAVGLLCGFVFGFAISWGGVIWVINSEIFPMRARGKAMSLTTAANWSGNIFLGLVTPLMIASKLDLTGTFLFYATWGIVAFVFVLCLVPETTNVSLEDMNQLFSISPFCNFIKRNIDSTL